MYINTHTDLGTASPSPGVDRLLGKELRIYLCRYSTYIFYV